MIAPNGFGEHRYPVDCWRFFTDGMVAIARYYRLEVMHAHTNAGPQNGGEQWFSKEYADSMLIAEKNYAGEARICDLENYECIPANQGDLRGELISYESRKQRENIQQLAEKLSSRIYSIRSEEN